MEVEKERVRKETEVDEGRNGERGTEGGGAATGRL